MAYTDFIAAIDLGTSHMVGMVGTKDASGALSIIAYEVENTSTGIRRGYVYNVKDAAANIKRLVLKLENKLEGAKISKVYVGIGGQSIRTLDHVVSRVLGSEGVVTEDTIVSLYDECKAFRPDMLTVLDVVAPTYIVDGKPELNPVGVLCHRIEARYKLIVGRPALRLNVSNSVTGLAGIDIAGIEIAPLSLGDVVLSENEKDLGCALINFGAGVTSVAIYKGGKLIDLSVVPLGCNLITKDITALHVVESEAERLKLTYGAAKADREHDMEIPLSAADGSVRKLNLYELNSVVEARMDEILQNVYARLESSGALPSLGAGVVIAGGGSALKGLPALMSERLKMEVRYASIRRGLVVGGDTMVAANPEFATAIGLLAAGTKNCAYYEAPKPAPEPKPEPKSEPKPEPKAETSPTVEPQPKPRPAKKKSFLGALADKLGSLKEGVQQELFLDEDLDKK